MTISWTLTNRAERRRIEKQFKDAGIDISTPGFFDDPRFLEIEKRDPRFLELYARFVECRSYDPAYLVEARRKIVAAAEVLQEAVAADGRLGACVDASGMLARILDRLGVWNYVAKCTLTVTFDKTLALSPRYFWVLDHGQFVAAHAAVVAPPFGILDVTAKRQPYEHQQAAVIPDLVLAENFTLDTWTAEDLANPTIRELARRFGYHSFASFLSAQHSDMLEVMEALPARRVLYPGTVDLKYVIVAVGGTIEPLEGITGYKPCGKTALELFNERILPKVNRR